MGFTFQIGDLAILISVALVVLGVRLLRMGWRNRSTPELLIGLYLVLSPPATSLAMRIPRFDPAYREALHLVTFCGFALAGLCLAAFAWRVFRPNAAWAKGLVAMLAVYLLGTCGALAVGASSPDAQSRSLASRIPLLVTYIWLFVECALHRRLLVRRLRLGLADPVVVNRFLLFEVWSGTLALLPGVMLMAATLLSAHGGDTYGSFFAAIVRVTGLVIYAALWLSFLPPQAYTRWLRRRHQERHPDAAASARAGG